MSELWKYKFIGTLIACLIAIYLLLPTALNLKNKAEKLQSQGKELPWYFSILPNEELNLGLDLRGGLYLELDVEVEKALDNQIQSLISDIKRYVAKDDLASLQVNKVTNQLLRVQVSAANQNIFRQKLEDTFGKDLFLIRQSAQELFYNIKSSPETARQEVLKTLQALPQFQGQVATSHDQKYLTIYAKNETLLSQIRNQLSQESLANHISPASEVNDVAYLQLTEQYIAQLKKDIMEQAAKAVRNRIDRYGVAEANVSRQSGGRLVVELPGVKNPDNVISIIKRTGQLEFRLVNDAIPTSKLQKIIADKTKELGIVKPYQEENLDKLNQNLAIELPENTEIAFQLNRDPQTKEVISYEPYLLSKTADVTGNMLENAKVETYQNQPYVSMSFNKTGTKKFGDLTAANVGKQLAIVLDNVVMSAPVIRSAITGGQAQIELGYGRFEVLFKEAQDLVLILREGALPASLNIASKNIIGPSLGKDSIDAGLKSILISGIGVFLFMLLYYRKAGLVANLSLITNLVFLFAILALFQASLTLPGLAGIALTIGMAVDANVIIFERMREEKHLGHDTAQIVNSGFGNAMSAIVDGNITTFIAGLVLFEFGTGPIKGFATTLMIGIATTLFTAIIFSRLIFDWLIYSRHTKNLGV